MPPISIPVAKQPSMDPYAAPMHTDEKSPAYHAHDDDIDSAPARSLHTHTACHTSRLKRLLPALLLTLLLLSGLLALAYILGDTDPAELIDGLLHVKRAVTGGGSGTGSSGSSFTRRKLYLIVVFGYVPPYIASILPSAGHPAAEFLPIYSSHLIYVQIQAPSRTPSAVPAIYAQRAAG
ncbi:hypothetical protein B0H11DRAFT_2412468 [Mycena galericulata]|nr:hypothetical protein B0H11DRAFT_2412468 [Mycena galericulata]